MGNAIKRGNEMLTKEEMKEADYVTCLRWGSKLILVPAIFLEIYIVFVTLSCPFSFYHIYTVCLQFRLKILGAQYLSESKRRWKIVDFSTASLSK